MANIMTLGSGYSPATASGDERHAEAVLGGVRARGGVLVANRAREYYASLKSKEEMAAELAENRRAMQAALDGESFADADDPFEGMEPGEIEAFLKKQAPDGDPYAGMSPEEINAHLHATQERTVRENLSFPKNLPGAGR